MTLTERPVMPPTGHTGDARLRGNVRRARRDQQRYHQPRSGQAEVVGVPPGAGEEAVRPVVRPQPRQARARQHPADGAPTGLGEETAGQRAERAERRCREQRREGRQQRRQGRRNL